MTTLVSCGHNERRKYQTEKTNHRSHCWNWRPMCYQGYSRTTYRTNNYPLGSEIADPLTDYIEYNRQWSPVRQFWEFSNRCSGYNKPFMYNEQVSSLLLSFFLSYFADGVVVWFFSKYSGGGLVSAFQSIAPCTCSSLDWLMYSDTKCWK